MNKSLTKNKSDDYSAGNVSPYGLHEQTTLDGIIFVGLCVMCTGILLMAIRLCYNYIRKFPTRKDSDLSDLDSPRPARTAVRYSAS